MESWGLDNQINNKNQNSLVLKSTQHVSLKDWLCLQGKKVPLCENCRSLPLLSSAGWVTPALGFSPKRSLLNPVWVYFYHCVDIPQNGADSQTSSWTNPADFLCGGLLWSTLVLWAAPWRKEKCWECDWFFPRGKFLSTSKWDMGYVIQLKLIKILCVPKWAMDSCPWHRYSWGDKALPKSSLIPALIQRPMEQRTGMISEEQVQRSKLYPKDTESPKDLETVRLPRWLHGKESSACNAGDLGSTSGSWRSPGGGNGNPLQYSCLENPMDRGAWQATVHGVAKRWTWLKWLSTCTVWNKAQNPLHRLFVKQFSINYDKYSKN